ncbi:MAG: hypothetical protein ACYTGH_01735 [Planctomycetota bacterium]
MQPHLCFKRFALCLLLLLTGVVSGADIADLREDALSNPTPPKPPAAEAKEKAPVKPMPKEKPVITEEVTCELCGGSGYREIAGDQVPCAGCRGAGNREEKRPDPAPAANPAIIPVHPWEPAVAPPAPEGPKEVIDQKAIQQILESNEKGLQLFPVTLADIPLAPATAIKFNTPWGAMPFALRDVYHHEPDRGPGFSAKVPRGWHMQKLKHNLLGGTQHRYTSPNGLSRVVVVIFPMAEAVDLPTFLAGVHVKLLSSFKLMEARRAALGRRSGIGVYYQGILLMRDAGCHLFLTRYKNKGYLAYGLYFDRPGGFEIARVMQSIRIF